MVIAVDFDGTCVTHDFPKVGKDIGAVPVLKELVAAGHRLILYTMRSSGGDYPIAIFDASQWFSKNDIPLYGVNKNPTQFWSTSPKVYAGLYIDDAALGCPLIFDASISDRPFVDWVSVRELLVKQGIL